MDAVQAFCEFSWHVNQQNHSDLSFTALDNALQRFHKKKGIFQKQKLLKSAYATVVDLLPRESHKLCEQKIYKIRAAMEVLVYVA